MGIRNRKCQSIKGRNLVLVGLWGSNTAGIPDQPVNWRQGPKTAVT